MDLGKDIAIKLIAENTPIISLFPGSFSPPHRSHFKVVQEAAKTSDQVQIIISNKGRDGYSPQLSLRIWENYLKLLPENVSVSIAKENTPITEVYSIVKEKSNNYIVLYGKEDSNRFNCINENREKYSNVEVLDVGQLGDVSATKLREAISKRNNLQIKSLIPEGIKVNDFLLNFQIHEIKVNNPQEIKFPIILNNIEDWLKIKNKIETLGYKWLYGETPELYDFPTKIILYKKSNKLLAITDLNEIKINNPIKKPIVYIDGQMPFIPDSDGNRYYGYRVEGDRFFWERRGRRDAFEDAIKYFKGRGTIKEDFYLYVNESDVIIKDSLDGLDEIKINNPAKILPTLIIKNDIVSTKINNEWLHGSLHNSEEGDLALFMRKDYKNYDELEKELKPYIHPGQIQNGVLMIIKLNEYPKRFLQKPLPEEKIPGGLAKGKSLIDIAKHHRIPQADIFKQLQKGINVEMEHTTSKEIAKEIAMDHLWEDPKYYDKLDSIEEIKINKPVKFWKYDTELKIGDRIRVPDKFMKDDIFVYLGGDILKDEATEHNYSIKAMKRMYDLDLEQIKNRTQTHKIQEIKINKPFPSFPITLNNDIEAQQIAEKLYNMGYKADWSYNPHFYQEFPFQQKEGENFKPIILTSQGKELEWIPAEHQNHVEDEEDIIYEIGKNAIKEVLGEIKVNKPGLNFPIKIETPEQAQKVGKILKDRGYIFKDYIDREDPEINSFNEFEPFFQLKNFYPFNIIQYDGNILDYNYITELNESIQINPKLYIKLLNTLVEDCCKELEIPKPVIKLINNDKYTKEHSSYGGYFPGQDLIKLVIYSRNCKDSLLTLCHEIRHHWQYVNGLLKPDSGGDGSPEENDCNSFAGQYLRKFGRKYPEIYFLKYS